jgi:hypothetical protein
MRLRDAAEKVAGRLGDRAVDPLVISLALRRSRRAQAPYYTYDFAALLLHGRVLNNPAAMDRVRKLAGDDGTQPEVRSAATEFLENFEREMASIRNEPATSAPAVSSAPSTVQERTQRDSSRRLPVIAASDLPATFVPVETEQGDGGPLAEDAIRAWNSGDHDRAEGLWREALAHGLTPTWAAFAHENLGEIELDRGDILGGVESLGRCLRTRPITRTAAHESSVRLQLIYGAAGRSEERDALAAVAAASARPGVLLDFAYTEKLKDLTLRCGAW